MATHSSSLAQKIPQTEEPGKLQSMGLQESKSQIQFSNPGAGRDWGPEEKEMTEDEMAGWHHQLDRHEFE